MRPGPEEPDVKLDNMSREDLKKIQKSMRNPEFVGLLNEYMIQISDPKNKNEYDEYLRQLEREHELPKHMKIVEVIPKFCFRTFLVSQKNKKHEMKFFINMCQSEYLQKPGCEPVAGEDGKVGYNWKVPNSMGKIRYDQDVKNDPCQVVDIAFHPDTYHMASKKEFQEMMVNIALESAERQLGERKETLSRDYVILKKLKCKGVDGKPALMPIRYIQGKLYNKGEGPSNEPERDLDGKETKLQKEISKQKQDFEKEKGEKNKEQEYEKEEDLEDKPKLVVDMQKGVQRPKYSAIYTYPIDYSEFIDSPYTKRRTVPTVYNIQFAIPRVESMEEVADQKLEINDKKIVLKIGEKYFIDLQLQELKLKYVLVTSSAKAKYDKKKKSLRIIIPVDQTVKYQSENVKEEVKEEKEEEKVVEDETWKNKVLDFSEPSVTVKMLENKQAEEEKPKLVQQIDQDDVTQEKKPESSIPQDQDQIQEEPSQIVPKKFTMSNYYSKPKKEVKSGQSKRIGYLFQETSDKIVLVIQMKNYKKEDVRFLNIGKTQYLVIWDQKSQGDQVESKFEHLKIGVEEDKIEKMEAVFRVGFLAVMIQKKVEEKGKFWQKESVEAIIHSSQTEQDQLKEFKEYFEAKTLELEQKRIIQQELQQRQRQRIEAQQANKKQQGAIPIQGENPHFITQSKQGPQQSDTKKASKVQALSGNPQSMFQNLQPQFITFTAPFVFALD